MGRAGFSQPWMPGWTRQRLGDRVSNCYPEALCRARDAAVLGAARFAAGEYVNAAKTLPVYLRNKVAWKKGRGP